MKLLLAIDDSACSDVAIKAVEERPWPKGSEARIISVIDPPLSPTPQLMRVTNNQVDDLVQAVQLQYEAILKTAARRLNNGRSGPIRVTEVVKQGHASEEIIKEAEAWGADIIVIGSHGRRGFNRLWLGSVSQMVLNHAHCSVEIVKCQEEKV